MIKLWAALPIQISMMIFQLISSLAKKAKPNNQREILDSRALLINSKKEKMNPGDKVNLNRLLKKNLPRVLPLMCQK